MERPLGHRQSAVGIEAGQEIAGQNNLEDRKKNGQPSETAHLLLKNVLGGRDSKNDIMRCVKLLVTIDSLSSYKLKELLPLECEHCRKVFYKRKGDVTMSLKRHPDFALRFCSLKCHHLKRVKDTHIKVTCEQCGKIVVKQISWIKKNKYNFCSRSCNAKFQNSNKTLGASRKSKAETYLAELIRADFKALKIEENSRSVLPSRLELDLYLPDLKLAIELNGPLHFFSIFGQNKLRSIKDKDAKKQDEAQTIGCNLVVLNTSSYKYWPETKKFLDDEYNRRLKPFIRDLNNVLAI